MAKYYAIKKGRRSNVIATTWDECSALVTGYSGAVFKSFPTRREAEKYLATAEHLATAERPTTTERPTLLDVSPEPAPPVSSSSPDSLAVQIWKLSFAGPSSSDNSYIFYTDGSFSMGSAGFAVVNITTGEVLYGPVEGDKTSQRAELTAILYALIWAEDDGKSCEIRTDSEYSMKTLTEYVPSWIRRFGEEPRRWRTAGGEPVKNLDLITEILQTTTKYTIRHVRGHSGNEFNEVADTYAKKGRNVPKNILTKY